MLASSPALDFDACFLITTLLFLSTNSVLSASNIRGQLDIPLERYGFIENRAPH